MSFTFIGGLPSGYRFYDFDMVFLRHIEVRDTPMIETMKEFKRPADVFLFLRKILPDLNDKQIWSLTLDDCVYILTYLRKICYTESPITVTWDCFNQVVTHSELRLQFHPDKLGLPDHELHSLQLTRRTCDRKNSELIYAHAYSYSLKSPDWSKYESVPDKYSVPTLYDAHLLNEMEDLDEWPMYVQFKTQLLWLKANTVEEKVKAFNELDPDDLDVVAGYAKDYDHGVTLTYRLRCFDCGYHPTVTKDLTLYSVLPVISTTSVMNMQYTMFAVKNILVPEDTPIQKLLYWHNAYQKDKQEKKNKAKTAKK